MTSTEPQRLDREPAFEWAHPGLHLRFDHGEDHPVRLVHWATGPDSPSVACAHGDRRRDEITLPGLCGRTVEQVYPAALPEWKIRPEEGLPVVDVPAGPAARIFAVR